MALVLGTNVGFVTVAPTADPGAASVTADARAYSFMGTSPGMNIIVTEVGWYVDAANPGSAGDFMVGIYSDDGTDEPNELLGSSILTAKGTSGGWVGGSVNIGLSANTNYWLAFSLENTSSFTQTNRDLTFGDGIAHYNSVKLPLPSDWGTSDFKDTSATHAIYAVYEEAPAGGTNMQVNIGDVWKEVPLMKINIGDAWKDVAGAQINIGDAWKTIF